MDQIIQIPTEKLLPNPYQPRKQFKSEDMLSLSESIKENGVLQPLLCRQINNSDYYEVVAGERRLRASILANMQTVPCVIIDCDYESSAVFSILENIQRSDLDFFEEAQAISQLINHFGMTQEQIGKKLGKSQSSLSNKLRLLKLPVDVRYFIEHEGLTERHARALLRLDSEKDMWTTLKLIKEKHLNVEQTEAYIDTITDKKIKPRRNVVKIFKDVRIFVNTVNRAIQTMKDAGIDAESDKTETEEYIEFRVRIPKDAQNAAQNTHKCTNPA
ncbi:MAG: ParB/RepB/Spo0J family partition protein [Eubacterium sp.]|nr:ParB/RepB/Spo0J family partition protein [Eubacterium sp.]MDE6155770.1 ParB/RepB/Spo0J family partition protein [Eubacterium sp.]MDE6766992.1 ParB/RepB/Spo0J family partition protein [Eubacterium sp.]